MSSPHPPAMMPAARVLTPASAPGAIAVVGVFHPSPALCEALRCAAQPDHQGTQDRVRVCDLLGVDTGVVVTMAGTLLLMPHGGRAVVRALLGALAARGVRILPAHYDQTSVPHAHDLAQAKLEFPEARSAIEALALRTLALAQSPRAVPVLLRQHDLWSARPSPASVLSPQCPLRHLLTPALVVAVGPANIGKSSLLNALARRSVSIVADEEGTTRDHVGVLLDCEGLVVRYVDTPGLRALPDEASPALAIEARAHEAARALMARADLLLLMGDAAKPPPDVGALGVAATCPALCVALRTDLALPPWPADVLTSVAPGREPTGLEALVRSLRTTLLPPSIEQAPQPWQFWHSPDDGAAR